MAHSDIKKRTRISRCVILDSNDSPKISMHVEIVVQDQMIIYHLLLQHSLSLNIIIYLDSTAY